MLTVIFVSLLSLASASFKHCPVSESLCPSLCKSFEKEVPRPTLFDMCQKGCNAAARIGADVDCKKSCMHTDLPRPTTGNACKSGCNTALAEINRCDAHAASKATEL